MTLKQQSVHLRLRESTCVSPPASVVIHPISQWAPQEVPGYTVPPTGGPGVRWASPCYLPLGRRRTTAPRPLHRRWLRPPWLQSPPPLRQSGPWWGGRAGPVPGGHQTPGSGPEGRSGIQAGPDPSHGSCGPHGAGSAPCRQSQKSSKKLIT